MFGLNIDLVPENWPETAPCYFFGTSNWDTNHNVLGKLSTVDDADKEKQVAKPDFGTSAKPDFLVGSSEEETQWLNLPISASASGSGSGSAPSLAAAKQKPEKKILKVRQNRPGPISKSSPYKGVTFFPKSARWESHIWDCGKQVYIAAFDTPHAAARAYDLVAIKFRGVHSDINFAASDYKEDMKQMKNLTKEEFVQVLRRQQRQLQLQRTGFSWMNSRYQTTVAAPTCGQSEAENGQFHENKANDKAVTECTCNYKLMPVDANNEGFSK